MGLLYLLPFTDRGTVFFLFLFVVMLVCLRRIILVILVCHRLAFYITEHCACRKISNKSTNQMQQFLKFIA